MGAAKKWAMSKATEDTDSDQESMEDLDAGARIHDRLAGTSHNAVMIQDDIWGTNLPNGLLQWFGFDFKQVELPDEGILPRENPPRWVGTPPGFTLRTRVADASVAVRAQDLETPRMMPGGDEEYAVPSLYRVGGQGPRAGAARGVHLP